MISLLRRNRSTIGLDIGSGFVKAVCIDHSGREPVITHAGHIPLVADAIVEGEVMDPQLVVEAVRSLVEGMAAKPKQVNTAVGGRDVIVKRIQMDRMKQDDAREVIRWEAEQYVPFDMENVQLDFQIVDPAADGLQMNVLLVAAKREVVDHRVDLLRQADLAPSMVDVDAFALFNAFEYNYPEAMTGVCVVANVGHEMSTVNVLQDGSIMLTRDIPFGSRRIRENLRRMQGLTADEAERVVLGTSDRQADYMPALREGCADLAMGIERAVAFLAMNEARGDALGAVYLCGGGARIPGLVDAVAERLRARTEIANPVQRVQVAPEVATLFPLEELAPMLMIPIGLALRTAA